MFLGTGHYDGGKAGGGGFFKDDVEYANAAALNMDVGGLNSVAYNSSKVWSNNINATNNPTNAFDGNKRTSQNQQLWFLRLYSQILEDFLVA